MTRAVRAASGSRCVRPLAEIKLRLRHWPRIPAEVLYLLSVRPSVLGSRLLEGFARELEAPRRLRSLANVFHARTPYLDDALRLGFQSGKGGCIRGLSKVAGIDGSVSCVDGHC